MERGLTSAEAYRATALHYRQLAADDPDNRWRLLSDAERWEHLAEQILASRQKNRVAENARSVIQAETIHLPPSQPDAISGPRLRAPPSKPIRRR